MGFIYSFAPDAGEGGLDFLFHPSGKVAVCRHKRLLRAANAYSASISLGTIKAAPQARNVSNRRWSVSAANAEPAAGCNANLSPARAEQNRD